MPRNSGPEGELTFEEKLALIRSLWPLGDSVWEFLDAMKAAGFAAFAPRERWIESFAKDQQEIDVHREYVREWAKYALGLGLAPLGFGRYSENGFPPGLLRLKQIRDQENNGVPELELHRHFSQDESYWRIQIDPCRRRIDRSLATADGLPAIEKAAIGEESAIHATALSRRYSMLTIVLRDRIAFSKAKLRQELSPLGFHIDRKRSTFIAPVLTKTITPEWHLCFELVPDGIFFDAVHGRFDLRLTLRRDLDHRAFDPEVHLEIRYFWILDALHVYSGFSTIRELETVILARTFLYKLMAPILEGALRDHLSREFSKAS